MIFWYRLDEDHNPVPVYDLKGLRDKDVVVGKDTINDVDVSTVFLNLDHNHSGEGPPILFETMIFGGKYDQYQWRYCTWDEAKKGHDSVVKQIKMGRLFIE
jgi:hypothetical protein